MESIKTLKISYVIVWLVWEWVNEWINEFNDV